MCKKKLVIAVDFNGTCVTYAYPDATGEDIGAVPVLKRLLKEGHSLVLMTGIEREGEFELPIVKERWDDMMKWKKLSSDYLIKRPWLTARKDKVELPDGRIIPEYYVLEYPDWVNVIAITKDGRFVMERQYRYGADSMNYEIPCGVMEVGETSKTSGLLELELMLISTSLVPIVGASNLKVCSWV